MPMRTHSADFHWKPASLELVLLMEHLKLRTPREHWFFSIWEVDDRIAATKLYESRAVIARWLHRLELLEWWYLLNSCILAWPEWIVLHILMLATTGQVYRKLLCNSPKLPTSKSLAPLWSSLCHLDSVTYSGHMNGKIYLVIIDAHSTSTTLNELLHHVLHGLGYLIRL